MTQTRQLAAIMFTDIVGYTGLMGQDEHQGFELLKKNRQLQRPIIEACHGRWIKELGDGVLASFQTVSDAVHAAIRIQEECNGTGDFQLRIGIHQGEVILEDEDMFGDTVNIAARIQAAADPGCIMISEAVHHNISNKKDIQTHFVKEETLKNVSRPVRMYQVLFAGSKTMASTDVEDTVVENSIAVLPFANMSSDPEQEFFSDGISEEIINMLAQVPGLKVTGRTSSFAFKGKHLDLRVIGEQLKVSHILEGGVRKSGNRLRITAQLIKVEDGYHLYSEKFDRELEDVFDIQDEISTAILGAIKLKLFGADKAAVFKKYTDNVEVYQLYLKGRFYYNHYTPDNLYKAIEYLEKATKTEPDYAPAYVGLSFCYISLWYWNWAPADQCLPQGVQAAQKSIQIDDQIAESHLAIGRVKLHYEWNIPEALVEYRKSIAINPNSAECYVQLGFCATLTGDYTDAIKHAKKADELDPFSLLNLYFISAIYWGAGNAETAAKYAERILSIEPNFFAGHIVKAEYLFEINKPKEAVAAAEKVVQLNYGAYTLQNLSQAYCRAGEIEKARDVIEKMKQAGAEMGGNYYLGLAYAALGEFDLAFQHLAKAEQDREGNLLWIQCYARYLPGFRKDPRTRKLIEKIGLPYLLS